MLELCTCTTAQLSECCTVLWTASYKDTESKYNVCLGNKLRVRPRVNIYLQQTNEQQPVNHVSWFSVVVNMLASTAMCTRPFKPRPRRDPRGPRYIAMRPRWDPRGLRYIALRPRRWELCQRRDRDQDIAASETLARHTVKTNEHH